MNATQQKLIDQGERCACCGGLIPIDKKATLDPIKNLVVCGSCMFVIRGVRACAKRGISLDKIIIYEMIDTTDTT